jgi:hypothetical protein
MLNLSNIILTIRGSAKRFSPHEYYIYVAFTYIFDIEHKILEQLPSTVVS